MSGREDPLGGALPWDEAMVAHHELYDEEADEAFFQAIIDEHDAVLEAADQADFERATNRGDEGGFLLDYATEQLTRRAGLTSTPHRSEISLFRGLPGLLAAAEASELVEAGVTPQDREERRQIADAAITAALDLKRQIDERQDNELQGKIDALLQMYAKAVGQLKELRSRTAAASQARRIKGRPERAAAVWAQHPTYTVHRVAKEIAQPGEDVRSVSRSIADLAPPTSKTVAQRAPKAPA
jgi:hypothetical protein